MDKGPGLRAAAQDGALAVFGRCWCCRLFGLARERSSPSGSTRRSGPNMEREGLPADPVRGPGKRALEFLTVVPTMTWS